MSAKNIGLVGAPPRGFKLMKKVRYGDRVWETWAKGSLFSPDFRWCHVYRRIRQGGRMSRWEVPS